jgi:hypothetical protein
MKYILLSAFILTITASSANAVTNKEMLLNFNTCAANAIAIKDKFEEEFYTNAAIDLAFESSDGKISSSTIRKGIKETVHNLKKSGMSYKDLYANYGKYCGPGDVRGYANYYYNQRQNMKN